MDRTTHQQPFRSPSKLSPPRLKPTPTNANSTYNLKHLDVPTLVPERPVSDVAVSSRLQSTLVREWIIPRYLYTSGRTGPSIKKMELAYYDNPRVFIS